MASNTFKLQVMTPAGAVLDEEVKEVYLPSSNGEIGILPGHTKYTGNLGTGVLSYVPNGGTSTRSIVISEGFCNFANDTLTVLTDAADLPDQINKDGLHKAKEDAKKTFESTDPTDSNWTVNRAKLARFEAMERLLTH